MYQRFILLDEQIKKKGEMSSTLISEVRQIDWGCIVFVMGRSPLQVIKGTLYYAPIYWTREEAEKIWEEANERISQIDERFDPIDIERKENNKFKLIFSEDEFDDKKERKVEAKQHRKIAA